MLIRRLNVQRHGIMNAGSDAFVLESLLQRFAICEADDEEMPHRFGVWIDRLRAKLTRRQRIEIKIGVRSPLVVPLVEVTQLDAQDRRL